MELWIVQTHNVHKCMAISLACDLTVEWQSPFLHLPSLLVALFLVVHSPLPSASVPSPSVSGPSGKALLQPQLVWRKYINSGALDHMIPLLPSCDIL